jgi:8-oxo-dGTP pyrophosphatase MutT (NUDIX family)
MTQAPQPNERCATEPALAATAVLLRDGAEGLEVLLLERPSDRGSFAGAWVFPGGRVDPEDWASGAREGNATEDSALEDSALEESAARRAAIREVREETALVVAPDHLATVACWTPPASAPRRFRTWFFIAPAPDGELVLSPEEIVDFTWIRPAAALELHASGGLNLVPPTWVTLDGLMSHGTVAAALEDARRRPVQTFATRAGAGATVLLWEGDVAYDDDTLVDAAGARHRLELAKLPWVYHRYS